jgi:hypothetical protein
MLLPDAFRQGTMPDLLLAITPDTARFAGAISFKSVSTGGRLAWEILLHVTVNHRRRGVGSCLVGSVAQRARTAGLQTLIANHDVERDPAAADFLRSLRFEHSMRLSQSRVDLDRYLGVLEPIRDRLRLRGKLPPTASVMPLDDAPREAVSRFLATHLYQAAAGDGIDLPLPECWNRLSVRDASVVLLDGAEVIGLGWGEAVRDCVTGHYRLIRPDYRGGWANVLLCADGMRLLHTRGMRTAEFVTTTRTPDTEAMINLYGAQRIKTMDRYVLPAGCGGGK